MFLHQHALLCLAQVVGSAINSSTPVAAEVLPMEQVEAFASQVSQQAGASVRVTRMGGEIRCEIDVEVLAPSSEPGARPEKRTFAVLATALPYIDAETQQARLAAALRAERADGRDLRPALP